MRMSRGLVIYVELKSVNKKIFSPIKKTARESRNPISSTVGGYIRIVSAKNERFPVKSRNVLTSKISLFCVIVLIKMPWVKNNNKVFYPKRLIFLFFCIIRIIFSH